MRVRIPRLALMKINKARKKVLQDLVEEKDEAGRMKKHTKWYWRLRGWSVQFEYWVIAFALPVSIILWMVTGDFWKGLSFWAVVQVYCLSANFRGMSLHIENLVEWIIGETV